MIICILIKRHIIHLLSMSVAMSDKTIATAMDYAYNDDLKGT